MDYSTLILKEMSPYARRILYFKEYSREWINARKNIEKDFGQILCIENKRRIIELYLVMSEANRMNRYGMDNIDLVMEGRNIIKNIMPEMEYEESCELLLSR